MANSHKLHSAFLPQAPLGQCESPPVGSWPLCLLVTFLGPVSSTAYAYEALPIGQVPGLLLLVIDAHVGEMLSFSVRALGCDGENFSISGNNGSRRGHHLTALRQSGLNRIWRGQVGRNRVCTVGPVSSDRISLVIQVAGVFELLSAAISVDAIDVDFHARRARYHDSGFALSRRPRDKFGFLHIEFPGSEKRVSLAKYQFRKRQSQNNRHQKRKEFLHC